MTIIPPTYRRLLRYLRPYLFPYVALAVAAMLVLSATKAPSHSLPRASSISSRR